MCNVVAVLLQLHQHYEQGNGDDASRKTSSTSKSTNSNRFVGFFYVSI